jgi:hypothetical protein
VGFNECHSERVLFNTSTMLKIEKDPFAMTSRNPTDAAKRQNDFSAE